MNILLAIIAFFFAQAAPAASLDEACPEISQFEARIFRCGQNEDVAAQAAFCAQEIAGSWNAATAAALPALQALGKSGKQSATEADSKLAYATALLAIERQVRLMQHYTSRLEQYPLAMIDVPGSRGDEDSLSCFNEAFHQVQGTINALDDEIIKAKGVYELASQRKLVSLEREGGLSAPVTIAKLGGKAKMSALPSGRPANRDSDITGVQEKRSPSPLPARKPSQVRTLKRGPDGLPSK